MQKQKPPEATKTVYPILRQIVNLIPPNVFHAEASATKDLSRAFTPWSHVVALIYLQLTKTESLNGVWVRRSIVRLLEMYGTAGGWKSDGAKPKPQHGHDFLKTSLETLFHPHLASSIRPVAFTSKQPMSRRPFCLRGRPIRSGSA